MLRTAIITDFHSPAYLLVPEDEDTGNVILTSKQEEGLWGQFQTTFYVVQSEK